MFKKHMRLSDLLSDPKQDCDMSYVDKKPTFHSKLESYDMQLIHFLAEYGHIYLRNLYNIHPHAARWADHLSMLEYRNFVCRTGNMLYLGEEGIKLCEDRCAKRFIPSGGKPTTYIKKNALSKIASEFVRQGFTVSEHDASDYMFLQAKVVKGSRYGGLQSTSILGFVLGQGVRAGVYYEEPKNFAEQRKQAIKLQKIGISTMIILTKERSRKKTIETICGKTQIYYILRDKQGYEKIKKIISSPSQNNLGKGAFMNTANCRKHNRIPIKDYPAVMNVIQMCEIEGRDDYEE